MIDAQAVSAHLEKLGSLNRDTHDLQRTKAADWLEEQLAQLSFEHHRDTAGNHWIKVPGVSKRTVVLGSCLQPETQADDLDSSLGMIVSLEALKALTQRFDGPPPCTLHTVIWSEAGTAGSHGSATPDRSSAELGNAIAYLELHLEPASQLEEAGAPLGVAASSPDGDSFQVHPQLTALCDEAIRELTGLSASLPAGAAPHASAMARLGVAAAVMYVQKPSTANGAASESAARLHLLQASEAFGRWAESTVHAVAGDEVDLWALEHRVPHSS